MVTRSPKADALNTPHLPTAGGLWPLWPVDWGVTYSVIRPPPRA